MMHEGQPHPEQSEAILAPETNATYLEAKRKAAALYEVDTNLVIRGDFSSPNLTRIEEFSKNLEQKYGKSEIRDVLLWHVLGGSTPTPGHTFTKLDFEADDSVEAFIDTLYQENIQQGAIPPEEAHGQPIP